MDLPNLTIEKYTDQRARWPETGKVILAQHDDQSVIVYQAYNQSIGRYAGEHGKFGAEFSLSRMTWIKPNFLWMMYRSGWGTKENQQVTLAIKIRRSAFDQMLALAVPSSFDAEKYASRELWQQHVKESDIRLQWDPDHDPYGSKQQRRAIQLGPRGHAVYQFNNDWILSITDISDFVTEQRTYIQSGNLNALCTPAESVYLPSDDKLSERLGLGIG